MASEFRNMRLFTAIELPEEWRSALAKESERLRTAAHDAVKWVRPELMHVTLVFLGNQPQTGIEGIRAAMDGAAERSSPFSISLGHSGSFGSPERLRALWVGLQNPPDELRRLHAELVKQLSQHQVSFDARPLVPHITIGRPRASIDKATSVRLNAALQRLEAFQVLPAPVAKLTLLESRLSPQGPEYRPLHRALLGGSDAS